MPCGDYTASTVGMLCVCMSPALDDRVTCPLVEVPCLSRTSRSFTHFRWLILFWESTVSRCPREPRQRQEPSPRATFLSPLPPTCCLLKWTNRDETHGGVFYDPEEAKSESSFYSASKIDPTTCFGSFGTSKLICGVPGSVGLSLYFSLIT